LLQRFLRTHGPVTMRDLRGRYGFDEEWLTRQLQELVRTREVVRGRFTRGADGPQWADRENLGELHRRSLTVLRKRVAPVPLPVYADFLTRWQHLHPDHRLSGSEGLRQVVGQLRACWLPVAAWAQEALPARVARYTPDLLHALSDAGEFLWVGRGSVEHPARAEAMFLQRGEGARLFGESEAEPELSPPARDMLEFMKEEGACFRQDLERALELSPARVQEGLAELALAGLVTNDDFGALRSLLGWKPPARKPVSALETELSARARERPPRPPDRAAVHRAKRLVRARLQISRPPEGRWSLVRRLSTWGRPAEPEAQVEAWARLLLLRYGIVSKHCLAGEDCPWTWSDLYQWLQRMELRGEVRRGYFVTGLHGAQFALAEAIESLREWKEEPGTDLLVLPAVDPANVFSSEVRPPAQTAAGEPLVAARQPGSYYVLEGGAPCLIAESGRVKTAAGATDELLPRAVRRLAAHVVDTRAPGARRLFRIGEWNGAPVLETPAADLLQSAGFQRRIRDAVWWGQEDERR
jgi:ATP-dependent Lhr-like helicase